MKVQGKMCYFWGSWRLCRRALTYDNLITFQRQDITCSIPVIDSLAFLCHMFKYTYIYFLKLVFSLLFVIGSIRFVLVDRWAKQRWSVGVFCSSATNMSADWWAKLNWSVEICCSKDYLKSWTLYRNTLKWLMLQAIKNDNKINKCSN